MSFNSPRLSVSYVPLDLNSTLSNGNCQLIAPLASLNQTYGVIEIQLPLISMCQGTGQSGPALAVMGGLNSHVLTSCNRRLVLQSQLPQVFFLFYEHARDHHVCPWSKLSTTVDSSAQAFRPSLRVDFSVSSSSDSAGAMSHVLRGKTLAALNVARPATVTVGGLQICRPGVSRTSRTVTLGRHFTTHSLKLADSDDTRNQPHNRPASRRKVDDRPWHRESSRALPKSTSPDPTGGDATKGW